MFYRATWNGQVIAESDDIFSVDGYHYFPPDSVRREYLVPSSTRSTCPWKGQARYFTLRLGDRENRDAAWCYAEPLPAAERIRGYIAFWHGVRVQQVRSGTDGASPKSSLLGRIAALLRG
ncbi:DUF427 domain-containing protein [Streptomyces ardesiacus]|uniref:DUF427 domain-containing protein n=1 Tax=Streptomyces ardesiacus TaxID=285564 RepID=UPI0007C715F0|nr:DUF427 domain-containing protein [Streptomyces sp. NBRC 110030]